VAQVAAGSGGGGETGGAAERRWPWSERGQLGRHRYSDSVVDERGPCGFLFFPNYPNRPKFENWKWMHYLAPNIPSFGMLLDWDIMNNVINCANIQIPTELELKILEQIQHLNIWWILKGI
jgi:hypothetical protein